MDKKILVSIKNLKQNFYINKRTTVHALNDISLDIYKGEVLGVVGESGCGKSTLGKAILKINQPSAGKIYYAGDLVAASSQEGGCTMTKKQYKNFCKKVQVVFQDPYSSLNPRHTTGKIIERGMKEHGLHSGNTKNEVKKLLKMVNLQEDMINRYPHEFSGGQRQRICIARALAIEPELLICDEPISALDVSIQSQIINLLGELKEKLGLTMVFISHDLSVVKYLCDRVAVMYLGNLVEIASSDEIYENPYHFYSQALLSAAMVADPDIEKKKKRIILEGDIPSPVNKIEGCAFAGRCPYKTEECLSKKPLLQEVKKDHFVACHYAEKIYESRCERV